MVCLFEHFFSQPSRPLRLNKSDLPDAQKIGAGIIDCTYGAKKMPRCIGNYTGGNSVEGILTNLL
jgi:hypothetical protein